MLHSGSQYFACCGKRICSGCAFAPVYDNRGNKIDKKICPFCRTPWSTSKEDTLERYKGRVETGDAYAIYDQGCDYRDGTDGYPQDYEKALEFWHRAVELGYSPAYVSIGYAYEHGRGVEIDKKKSIYYYELAAMGGDVEARYNLGIMEENAGNMNIALRHYIIAVEGGYADSLKEIQDLYTKGYTTKEDYMKALQSYQAYLGEIKSDARDSAAASHGFRYY